MPDTDDHHRLFVQHVSQDVSTYPEGYEQFPSSGSIPHRTACLRIVLQLLCAFANGADGALGVLDFLGVLFLIAR